MESIDIEVRPLRLSSSRCARRSAFSPTRALLTPSSLLLPRSRAAQDAKELFKKLGAGSATIKIPVFKVRRLPPCAVPSASSSRRRRGFSRRFAAASRRRAAAVSSSAAAATPPAPPLPPPLPLPHLFQKSLGELLGKELPADAKEHLATILNTISQIMDADGDGAITESEFITSGRLFLVIANGDSPFHNPDLFFDILDADLSGTVTLQELSRLFSSLLPAGASLGAAATRRRRRRHRRRRRRTHARNRWAASGGATAGT